MCYDDFHKNMPEVSICFYEDLHENYVQLVSGNENFFTFTLDDAAT